jgi:hypothetical protein
MPTRTARTAWNGSLETGGGQVELTSSQLGTYDVSFPKRASEQANGFTSPEELLAAAHSACYAMQFSAGLEAAVPGGSCGASWHSFLSFRVGGRRIRPLRQSNQWGEELFSGNRELARRVR